MINGLGKVNPFHVLYDHLIYRSWTVSHGKCIRTNINKTRIKYLSDLKTQINQDIQSIEKRALQVVFLGARKRLVFYISMEGNICQQYL